MKANLTTTKEVVETITICDKCGLEAGGDFHVLFEQEEIDESFDEKGYRVSFKDKTSHYPVNALSRSVTVYAGYIEVCGDCYQEMFGWRDTDE